MTSSTVTQDTSAEPSLATPSPDAGVRLSSSAGAAGGGDWVNVNVESLMVSQRVPRG